MSRRATRSGTSTAEAQQVLLTRRDAVSCESRLCRDAFETPVLRHSRACVLDNKEQTATTCQPERSSEGGAASSMVCVICRHAYRAVRLPAAECQGGMAASTEGGAPRKRACAGRQKGVKAMPRHVRQKQPLDMPLRAAHQNHEDAGNSKKSRLRAHA